jgi:hypothetical protein
MGIKSGSRIRDKHPGSYFRELRNIFWAKLPKFFDADADPGFFSAKLKYGNISDMSSG